MGLFPLKASYVRSIVCKAATSEAVSWSEEAADLRVGGIDGARERVELKGEHKAFVVELRGEVCRATMLLVIVFPQAVVEVPSSVLLINLRSVQQTVAEEEFEGEVTIAFAGRAHNVVVVAPCDDANLARREADVCRRRSC